MSSIFPGPILDFPEVTLPLEGAKAYLSQGENHQIIFMEFEKDAEVPEHSHESQWEDGVKYSYRKGDRFFIPRGKKHSAKVYAGYASIAFFNQKERYKKK